MSSTEIIDTVMKTIEKITELANEGLLCDGAHHKQWYLEQILKELGEEPIEHDEGVIP